MARWKLMTNHYLNVPNNEWEYTETDRKTNRPIRKKFAVPRYFNILDPGDWSSRWGATKDNEDGEVIVCHEGKGESTDHVFFGDPTPDMQPIDEEAKTISASLSKKWETRPDFSPGEYSQSLIDKFQMSMAEAQAKSSEIKGMDELLTSMKGVMESNAQIMVALTNQSAARRV